MNTGHAHRVAVPVGALLIALLGGCGEEYAPHERVLRVANWGGAQVESEFMKLERQIQHEFELTHPGVRVQVEQIPGQGQYAPKLVMMHVTGSVPDVIHLDASSAAVFINNNVVRDLMPYVRNDPEFDLDKFFRNAVDIARRGEELYAIPLDFTPMVMYFNRKLFDELLFPLEVPEEEPAWAMSLDDGVLPQRLREAFAEYHVPLAEDAACEPMPERYAWRVHSGDATYTLRKDAPDRLGVYEPEGIAAYPESGWTWDEFLATAGAVTVLIRVEVPDDDADRSALLGELDGGAVPAQVKAAFERYGLVISPHAELAVDRSRMRWTLHDHGLAFVLRREVREEQEVIDVYLAEGGGNPKLVPGFTPYSPGGESVGPEALTLRAPAQFGMYFENWMPFWVLWLWTNGGDVLSPDGSRATGCFDSPPSVEAVQFLVDLITKYRVVPHPRESAAAGVDLFRSDRAAMDLKGHWMMIDYRAEEIDFGIVGLPTNGVGPVTVIYEAGLSITERAEYPDLAWEYIKHLTSERVQVRRIASGLAISGNKKAAAHFADNPVEQEFLDQVQYARPPWGAKVEEYPFIEELGREMMEDILYSDGELPVQRAMHRTAKLIDAALERP